MAEDPVDAGGRGTGNEPAAAELLPDYLERSGIPCELAGRSPGRLNLVARLAGGGGPSLALIALTDTVGAELAARLIHSADERIPVDDLELGVHALRAAATTLGAR